MKRPLFVVLAGIILVLSLACGFVFTDPPETVTIEVTATPVSAPAPPTALPPPEETPEPEVIVVTATPEAEVDEPEPEPVPTPVPVGTSVPEWRDDQCLDAPMPRLRVNEWAYVNTTMKLLLMEEPYKGSNRLWAIPPGEWVKVVGGYDCNDSRIWWKVQYCPSSCMTGWVAEGSIEDPGQPGDPYWLVPEYLLP